MKLFLSLLYVGFIILGNILAAKEIISLPFGLAVPLGVFVIAPVFTVRDFIHRLYGKKIAYWNIIIAAVASFLVSTVQGNELLGKITIASLVAFVINESIDTEIYHKLAKKSYFWAIVGSNLVSSLIDSVLFIQIAFGWLSSLIIGQYLVKIIISVIFAFVRPNGNTFLLRSIRGKEMESSPH